MEARRIAGSLREQRTGPKAAGLHPVELSRQPCKAAAHTAPDRKYWCCAPAGDQHGSPSRGHVTGPTSVWCTVDAASRRIPLCACRQLCTARFGGHCRPSSRASQTTCSGFSVTIFLKSACCGFRSTFISPPGRQTLGQASLGLFSGWLKLLCPRARPAFRPQLWRPGRRSGTAARGVGDVVRQRPREGTRKQHHRGSPGTQRQPAQQRKVAVQPDAGQ